MTKIGVVSFPPGSRDTEENKAKLTEVAAEGGAVEVLVKAFDKFLPGDDGKGYLTGGALTIADIHVFNNIYSNLVDEQGWKSSYYGAILPRCAKMANYIEFIGNDPKMSAYMAKRKERPNPMGM